MGDKEFEVSIGMSRKWDAREAGREVAESTLFNLGSDPDFFLLFSTIHYKDHGGFEELLKGVWEVLPECTQLVGGTVAGFMNNYGSYTRGVSALAVSYENMDIAIGIGKNTKRNPKKAARQNANSIKNQMRNSTYSNKFLFSLVSGPVVPNIPGVGRAKIIRSKSFSKIAPKAFSFSQYFFQKGFGREDEVFEEISKELSDYKMIFGTSIDDYKGADNYNFVNREIITNSVISLGISTDLNLDSCTTHGMKGTDLSFDITKLSKDQHIIHEINNKPAVSELYDLFEWPEEFLDEKTMLYRILYYPISSIRHGREVPVVMLFIIGESIVTPCMVEKGKVKVLSINGKNIVNAIKDNLENFGEYQPRFGLCSACCSIPQTLGYKVDIINEYLSQKFKKNPYILFWCAGEGTYTPNKGLTYANMSYNTAIFS